MKTKIKVLPSNAFDTPSKRKELARLVAGTIAGGLVYRQPYLVDRNDQYIWVVDCSGNWRVVFDQDDFCYFHLEHLYGNDEATTGLTQFIAYKLDARVVVTSN